MPQTSFLSNAQKTSFWTFLPPVEASKLHFGAYRRGFPDGSGDPNMLKNGQKGLPRCRKAQSNVQNTLEVLRNTLPNFRKIVEFGRFRQHRLGQSKQFRPKVDTQEASGLPMNDPLPCPSLCCRNVANSIIFRKLGNGFLNTPKVFWTLGSFLSDPFWASKIANFWIPPRYQRFFIGLSGGSGLPDKRPIRNVKPAKRSLPLHYTVKKFLRRSREIFFRSTAKILRKKYKNFSRRFWCKDA